MDEITHKNIAKVNKISLATAYRNYPVVRPVVSQAQIYLLALHGYSIRETAAILGISKDRVWRCLNGL